MSETNSRIETIMSRYMERNKEKQENLRFIQDIARRNTPRLSEEQVLSFYKR